MLKLLPWLPSAKLTNVYAHGWLPLKTTLPPESGQAVRLEESVVALMFAQGYCHWLAGAVKESERQVGVRSLKWAVALDAKARRARVEESILNGRVVGCEELLERGWMFVMLDAACPNCLTISAHQNSRVLPTLYIPTIYVYHFPHRIFT
jgi:hypothetical protein